MPKALLLTLGHNSSAILLNDDGRVLCGYEQERITGIKSDSSFPLEAIEEIQLHYDIPKDVEIYVSHWFLNGKLVINKWWNPLVLFEKFPDAKILAVNADFTHHDAHCWSGIAFFDDKIPQGKANYCVVADGFGTFGESLSVYKLNFMNDPKLIHRAFGFDASLGLLYQYTIAFLGMKENQDEYKLLGYETHIENILLTKDQKLTINNFINKWTEVLSSNILSYDLNAKFDPICSIDALPRLRERYSKELSTLVKDIGCEESTKFIVAYVVQSIVECVMLRVLRALLPAKIDNLLLVGGVFLNVKLNSLLSSVVTNETFIMPLSGDQGAAIGLYHAMTRKFRFPGHLFWGKRKLTAKTPTSDSLIYARDVIQASTLIKSYLKANYIVNLVRGAMEFGPRSLCNTSTLALPTQANVEYINHANGRDTFMPMAPVILDEDLNALFVMPEKVRNSLTFMICTRNYRHQCENNAIGHKLPYSSVRTGRPQVVSKFSDPLMYGLLKAVPNNVLINTSFNVHGKPIAFKDVEYHHNYQQKRDIAKRMVTIVVENE